MGSNELPQREDLEDVTPYVDVSGDVGASESELVWREGNPPQGIAGTKKDGGVRFGGAQRAAVPTENPYGRLPAQHPSQERLKSMGDGIHMKLLYTSRIHVK
jgi:hypothetical protein